MSGGLRPHPATRAARLEQLAYQLETREGARTAPEAAWERACALAEPEELEELVRLEETVDSYEPGDWAKLEPLQRLRALKERIMFRAAPTLAESFRARRDIPLYALQGLKEQAHREHEEWSLKDYATFEEAVAALRCLFYRPYTIGTLHWLREHAVRSGLEPVTDLEEAKSLVEEIVAALDAGDTDWAQSILISERRHGGD
jgi:hypothetical protein